jgi:hypothetical protein
VKPPWKSARPQCQIRMPGLLTLLTQVADMPFGGAQALVTVLLVRFGGLAQPSTQTTAPLRSYLLDAFFVGQPGK